jgi:hypothetical protein
VERTQHREERAQWKGIAQRRGRGRIQKGEAQPKRERAQQEKMAHARETKVNGHSEEKEQRHSTERRAQHRRKAPQSRHNQRRGRT